MSRVLFISMIVLSLLNNFLYARYNKKHSNYKKNRYKLVHDKLNYTSYKDSQTKKIKRVKLGLSKGIFMPKAKNNSKTSKGFLRDSKYFWKEYKKLYHNELSMKNQLRIKEGKAPIVDKKWVHFHKDHRPFKGEKLEHHHLDHRSYAIPLPESLHRSKGNSKFFHKNSNAYIKIIENVKKSKQFQSFSIHKKNRLEELTTKKSIKVKEKIYKLKNTENMKPLMGKEFIIRRKIENKLGL